jgi:hypothetical protein
VFEFPIDESDEEPQERHFITPAPLPVLSNPEMDQKLARFCSLISDKRSISELNQALRRTCQGIELNDFDEYGAPPIAYAVRSNRKDTVEWLLSFGVTLDVLVKGKSLLFLAASNEEEDGTEMFRYLLSLGIKPIPGELEKVTMNRTMKYWLKRAEESTFLQPNPIRDAHLKKLGLQRLPRLELSIVGQRAAISKLLNAVPAFVMGMGEKTKPLGKKRIFFLFCLFLKFFFSHSLFLFSNAICWTAWPWKNRFSCFFFCAFVSDFFGFLSFLFFWKELAAHFGRAIAGSDEKYIKIQCETLETRWELSGSGRGYQGNSEGAPLGNFISANAGSFCVVVLDEFEKMDFEVRETLLNALESGEWRDKRSGGKQGIINASKVVWILTTNALDHYIKSFFERNPHNDNISEEQMKNLLEKLEEELRPPTKNIFGAPLARRIDFVVPFIPFTPEEANVIADIDIRKFVNECGLPPPKVPKKDETPQVRDVKLILDEKVTEFFGGKYEQEGGASSIYKVIQAKIVHPVSCFDFSYFLSYLCSQTTKHQNYSQIIDLQ